MNIYILLYYLITLNTKIYISEQNVAQNGVQNGDKKGKREKIQ